MDNNFLSTGEEQKNESVSLKQFLSVFGASGTELFSGTYMSDYNPDWDDNKRYDIVERMKKGDPVIKAGLNLLKAPLLSTEWLIEGGKDEHRQFVEDNLFNMKNRTFKNFLESLLSGIEYGFSISEIVLGVKDGNIYLKDLPPRIQKSIERFETKEGTKGVTQRLQGDIANKGYVSIPYDKLLWFVNEQEGDDLSGVSILRSCYEAWYSKKTLEMIAKISCERYGVGVPWLQLPTNLNKEKKKKAEELLKNIRSNENNYLVTVGEGYKLEILTPSGNPHGQMTIDLIHYYTRNILVSLMAQSLDLGSKAGGSYALATEQKNDLLSYAEQKATYVEDLITNKLIKLLVDLRFGEQDEYPYLTHEPFDNIDQEKYAGALSTLVNAGLVVATPGVKKYMHDLYKLPELEDSEIPKSTQDELNELEEKIKNQYEL